MTAKFCNFFTLTYANINYTFTSHYVCDLNRNYNAKM
jgi:hypothetical protein